MEVHCSRSEVNSTDASDEIRVRDQRGQGNDAVILAAEDSLNRVVISHGPCSEQTREVATHLVLAYNHFAMKRLSDNNIKASQRVICLPLCAGHARNDHHRSSIYIKPLIYKLYSSTAVPPLNVSTDQVLFRRRCTEGRILVHAYV